MRMGMNRKLTLPDGRLPELLAPAGDPESVEAALRFGADAVYLGGRMLQLRAEKAALTDEEIRNAVDEAHEKGKKIYVTLNSIARGEEAEQAVEYARILYDLGVDAVLVADMGVLSSVKEGAPDLAVHISTQANILNARAARFYHDLGAERVVLGREATLDEIAEIRANTPRELSIEAFAHGALCMAYSGRCLISSYLTGRSANRGECTQPCRWEYRLLEEQRPGEYFPIEEGDGYSRILSSRDLCTIDMLEKILEAGADSLKLEGRMKSAYYVATITRAYRSRLDGTLSPEECRAELDCVAHRPYSEGLYRGEILQPGARGKDHPQEATFVGKVLGWEDGVLHMEQRNRFFEGETLEVLSPGRSVLTLRVTDLRTEEGVRVTSAPHPRQSLYMPCPCPVSAGDLIRRRDPKA